MPVQDPGLAKPNRVVLDCSSCSASRNTEWPAPQSPAPQELLQGALGALLNLLKHAQT